MRLGKTPDLSKNSDISLLLCLCCLTAIKPIKAGLPSGQRPWSRRGAGTGCGGTMIAGRASPCLHHRRIPCPCLSPTATNWHMGTPWKNDHHRTSSSHCYLEGPCASSSEFDHCSSTSACDSPRHLADLQGRHHCCHHRWAVSALPQTFLAWICPSSSSAPSAEKLHLGQYCDHLEELPLRASLRYVLPPLARE